MYYGFIDVSRATHSQGNSQYIYSPRYRLVPHLFVLFSSAPKRTGDLQHSHQIRRVVMAPQKFNNCPMGPVLLLTSLATTILAGPVYHEARLPLPTGNSTVGTPLNMVVAEAGSQTQTASPPELKKAIDEHLSLIVSVLVVVAVVFFAGLDRLTHK